MWHLGAQRGMTVDGEEAGVTRVEGEAWIRATGKADVS